MRGEIMPMRAEDAREIVRWRYPGELSFYDGSEADLDELCAGGYFVLKNAGSIQGFYCFGQPAQVAGYGYDQRFLDMGLGMRPDLIRKGLGLGFVTRGMEEARARFGKKPLRLSVAAFNRAAMTVYARAGFETIDAFDSPGGVTFYVMCQPDSGRWLDISAPCTADMRVYPGDPPFQSWGIQQVQQQGYRLSEFRMGCHCGTHLDAPAHVLAQGAAIEQAPLEQLNGLAALVDKERLESLPPGIRRVLIRDAHGDGIDRAQAEFLIRRGVCLVGVDALSVASGEAELPVHRRLLGAGCWILENLRLNGLEEGLYPLRCMPLLLKGLEAAPARAALGERQGRLK